MAEAEPPLDPHVLQEILAGTAGDVGTAFFDALVRHLAAAIGTRCAWVTEWLETPRRLRALSFWVGDRYYGDYEYDVEGTPCEPVVTSGRFHCVPDRVIELYAADTSLVELGAVSYMGLPLFDTDGALLGHLAVLHDQPMAEDPRVLAIFNIFASRGAAELRRLRRDRAIREREAKLAGLLDSAMDAIVEFDAAGAITRLNGSAERTFGAAAAAMLGRDIGRFFTPASRGKLAYLTRTLESQAPDHQSAWVPDGLEALRADGRGFPAEASLSRFEAGGRAFHALILRNVDARLEAEESIRRLMQETASLRAEIDALQGFDEILGRSPALLRLLADVNRVAGEDTTVLIAGETGTGKELIARAIHRRSPRATRPMIAVNCAAIPATLQESELFGHERGAFTGATERRPGRFVQADGGTIFLDEVGEMSPDLQAKLLRVLQEGEVQAVGSTKTTRVDVRVVAATNRDLDAMVRAGTFRADLLYRLNVFPLVAPPLRERGDDVVVLAEAFARMQAGKRGATAAPLTEADRERLRRYDWPGNVRELQNVIERAWITSPDGRRLNLARGLPEAAGRARIGPEVVVTGGAEPRVLTAAEILELERHNTLRALEAASWKIAGANGAAARLGLNPNTLTSRLRALGIRRPGRVPPS